MKKFFINKNEEAERIAERIVSDPDAEIIIVVPRDSALKEASENFALLHRKATAAKKTVVIESVDEDALALARKHRLEARHPLFHGDTRHSLSDIVSSNHMADKKEKKMHHKIAKTEADEETTEETEIVSEEPGGTRPESVLEYSEKTSTSIYEAEDEESPGRKRGKRVLIWGIVLLVVAGAALWFFGEKFGSAAVTLNFQKTPWPYQGNFVADKTLTSVDSARRALPAELFTQEKNFTQQFPASGNADVTQFAKGRITIVNAYSSQPQALVAKTRFVTSDGKIFRLTDAVVVPGAQVSGGKITPSSIDTNVVADKAGADYNTGPVDRLTIPGFQGTPKYDGFYGTLAQGTSGGFVGKKAVPTADDIAAAEKKVTDVLQSTLTNPLLNNQPVNFKILDGASDIRITKLTVNKDTDDHGNFSVIGAASMRALGFRDEDLKVLLGLIATQGSSTQTLQNLKVDFGKATPDFNKGTVSFSLSAQGIVAPVYSANDLKSQIVGLSITAARPIILGIPGIADAKVSLWPFWLGHVPGNPDRITVITN